MTVGAIFDFDGVLADTERLHLRAFQQAFESAGWQLDDRDYFDRYLGFTDRELMLTFAADRRLALDDARLRSLLAHKAAQFESMFAGAQMLFPGARACVERLAAVYPLAIASGALRHEIVAALSAGNLLQHFRAIVCADDGIPGKPAPDMYLMAASLLQVEPTQCVAIEDSPWGLKSARLAGMNAIGVMSGYPASALSDATHVVANVDEVTVELIGQLARAIAR